MWARVGESRRRKAGAVQVEAPARSKGGDELDPYVRCTLLPYKIKAECKPVTDAGHYPEWSDKHRNVLRLTVSKKQAQRVDPNIEPHLKLQAYDEDIGRDDFLGQAVLPLWSLVDAARYQAKREAERNREAEDEQKAFLQKARAQHSEFVAATAGRFAVQATKSERRRASVPDVWIDAAPKEDEAEDAETAASPALIPTPPPGRPPAVTASRNGGLEATPAKVLWTRADLEQGAHLEFPPPYELEHGTVKQVELMDTRKRTSSDRHRSFGWLEVRVAWEPVVQPRPNEAYDGAAAGQTEPPRPRDAWEGHDSQPAGTLTVEVLRGVGLQLLEEESVLARSSDSTLTIAAIVMVVLYLALGMVFYVLSEEHCQPAVAHQDELCGGAPGVDCSNYALGNASSCGAIVGCRFMPSVVGKPEECTAWTAIDALYFTVLTFTTIGYGDFTPKRSGTKVFTAIFALTGVVLIGGALGIVATYIVETIQNEMKLRIKEAKENEALTGQTNSAQAAESGNDDRAQKERRGLLMSGLQLVAVILLGMALFAGFGREGMGAADLFYASVITTCSIGYGDYSFPTQSGRALCVLYSLVAVVVCSRFVGGISAYIVNSKQDKLVQNALKRKLRVADIEEMDQDGDGSVDRGEFLQKMLVRLGKCEMSDIDDILSQFDKLDEDGSGTLTADDIAIAKQMEAEEDQRLAEAAAAAAAP